MLRNSPTLRRSLGRNLPCRRLNRRRRSSSKQELKGSKKKAAVVRSCMEMKNLKLYMQNKIIIQENEKLREQALLLHRENQDLLFQLQKLFSKPHSGGGSGGGCQLATSTSNYS